MDLLGEGLNLVGSDLGALHNVARGNVELVLNSVLHILDGRWHVNLLLLGMGLVSASSDDLTIIGGTSTVEDEDILSVVWDVRKRALGSNRDDILLQLLRGDLRNRVVRVNRRLERQVVGQETSNVWGSHGGTRDSVNSILASNPGRQDVQSWCKDIIALSVVGEVSALIGEGGGTDGDGKLGSGWRVVARVGVVVASSDSEVETGLDGTVHGGIERW